MAKTSPDVRSAIVRSAKYLRLLDEGLETRLEEEGELVRWRFSHREGMRHPVGPDFTVAAALTHLRWYLGADFRPLAVLLPHTGGDSTAEVYEPTAFENTRSPQLVTFSVPSKMTMTSIAKAIWARWRRGSSSTCSMPTR